MAEASRDFDAVHVEDVSRRFDRRRALAHVTFTAARGEAIALLGPNGAGKSTLLALLSTLLAPSSGRVTFGDVTADEGGALLRGRIGLLGHDLFLYAELTARENLTFFARLHGVRDVPSRVARAMDHARLAERADDRVSTFSRGMRQRLALERALINAPRLLLLDEPFTGLDDASAEMLTTRLTALRGAGTIIVMATHDFDTAEQVSTRAALLEAGRFQWIAEGAGSLRARYRNTLGIGASGVA